MSEKESIDLIKKSLEGDNNAFRQLITIHYDLIFRIAYKWCGRKEDAEDITQDSLLKIANKLDSFNQKSKFTTWIYSIVMNTAKDYLKSPKNHNLPLFDDNIIADDSKENAENLLIANDIMKAVYKLPDKLKNTLLLLISEGLSHKDISEILDVSEKTISWRIFEARKQLTAILAKGGN